MAVELSEEMKFIEQLSQCLAQMYNIQLSYLPNSPMFPFHLQGSPDLLVKGKFEEIVMSFIYMKLDVSSFQQASW